MHGGCWRHSGSGGDVRSSHSDKLERRFRRAAVGAYPVVRQIAPLPALLVFVVQIAAYVAYVRRHRALLFAEFRGRRTEGWLRRRGHSQTGFRCRLPSKIFDHRLGVRGTSQEARAVPLLFDRFLRGRHEAHVAQQDRTGQDTLVEDEATVSAPLPLDHLEWGLGMIADANHRAHSRSNVAPFKFAAPPVLPAIVPLGLDRSQS